MRETSCRSPAGLSGDSAARAKEEAVLSKPVERKNFAQRFPERGAADEDPPAAALGAG